ncbi:MAG: hypothetical protein NQU46_03420 [Methanolinea sp.]|nr:hypothetical protein [Methanolinea sp.]
MQLPRGTFRSMLFGKKVGDILDNLAKERFSGVCSLVCNGHTIEIVLDRGRIVLAGCDTSGGDEVLKMLVGLLSFSADAQLSDLTPVQLKLTWEFNHSCRVTNLDLLKQQTTPSSPTPSPTPEEKPPFVEEDRAREGRKRNMESNGLPEQRILTPHSGTMPDIQPTVQSEPVPAIPARGLNAGTGGIPRHDDDDFQGTEGYVLMDQDLKALDAMDVESMSRKIRENCRLMIERLHLDYLIADQERRQED